MRTTFDVFVVFDVRACRAELTMCYTAALVARGKHDTSVFVCHRSMMPERFSESCGSNKKTMRKMKRMRRRRGRRRTTPEQGSAVKLL